jgi:hypothetical protein
MSSSPERDGEAGTRPRTGLSTAVLWVVLVAAVTAAGWALLREDGGTPPVPAPATPAGPPPPGGFVTLADQDSGLDRAYDGCVKARGFDPGGVQVLLREGSVPWWVKTGHDVPAAMHRPCLQAIGGADPGLSSHGNP